MVFFEKGFGQIGHQLRTDTLAFCTRAYMQIVQIRTIIWIFLKIGTKETQQVAIFFGNQDVLIFGWMFKAFFPYGPSVVEHFLIQKMGTERFPVVLLPT